MLQRHHHKDGVSLYPLPCANYGHSANIAITLITASRLARVFYFQDSRESSSIRFVVKSSPTGLTPFKHKQHPLTTRGESMYRMEKITTGAAYGASAGSILNGMLNAYSPEQWNAIGVLVGIVIAVLTYLTNLYFKIREDNRRSRSRDEPDAEE